MVERNQGRNSRGNLKQKPRKNVSFVVCLFVFASSCLDSFLVQPKTCPRGGAASSGRESPNQ